MYWIIRKTPATDNNISSAILNVNASNDVMSFLGYKSTQIFGRIHALPSGYFRVSRYSLLNISTNRKNKESSNGPKITPMNPNNDRPMTTPKIVMSG